MDKSIHLPTYSGKANTDFCVGEHVLQYNKNRKFTLRTGALYRPVLLIVTIAVAIAIMAGIVYAIGDAPVTAVGLPGTEGNNAMDTQLITITDTAVPDLQAYWKFDENTGTAASDSSGNGHTGTINGAAWTQGKVNSALKFDGVNDYVSVPDSSNLEGMSAVTVSAWIKSNKTTLSSGTGIVTKWSQGTGGVYALRVSSSGIIASITSSTGTAQNTPVGWTGYSDLSWHLLTLTYNGSSLRLYVDGILFSEKTGITGTLKTDTRNVIIGAMTNGYYFNGAIDEVKIYNRALAASEIQIPDTNPLILQAPADVNSAAKTITNWKIDYFRYAATMQSETDKFPNLLGVYSGHTHKTSNQTILNIYGRKVRYTTLNGLINIGSWATPSNEVGYTTIESNNLTYRLVPYNVPTGVTGSGQLKFITVGDPQLDDPDPDGRTERLKQIVSFINKSDVDFAIFLGDMVSSGTDNEFIIAKNILSKLTKPYYVIAGNHDIKSAVTVEYCDTLGNWNTSDSANTPITTGTVIKQEGSGSLKITTSGENSKNDTVIATIPAANLKNDNYVEFWIRSNVAGNILKAGIGEKSIREHEFPVTINQANVWQKVILDINDLKVSQSQKDAITKFGFTFTGNQAATIYVDNIFGVKNYLFESYFGPKRRIENINGYQLLFIGIWREYVNTQTTTADSVIHWDFDFNNPAINKNAPTLVFAHGPIYNALSPVSLGNPIVIDIVDPNPIVTNNAPSAFLPGITTVTWKATDHAGNNATDTQYVTITDTTSPTIDAPANITKKATGIRTPVNLGTPIVNDKIDNTPTITNNAPPDGFPIGTTKVTWTIKDDSGNSAAATQFVTIN